MSAQTEKQAPAPAIPPSIAERIAWWALLAIPAAVPVALAKLPFTTAPAFTLRPTVYPKLLALAVLVAVALIAWTVAMLTGRVKVRALPLGWLLAAFLGLSAVSTVVGVSPITGFFGSVYQAAGLFVMLLCAAVYFLLVQLVSTPARFRAMSWSVVAGATLVSAVGLLQWAGFDPLRLGLQYNYGWLRVGSLLGNSDMAGAYLVLPLVIAGSLGARASTPRLRMLGGLAFLAILGCLVATGTRGAWLGALAGMIALAIVLSRGGKVSRNVYLAGGVALAAGVVLAALNARSIATRFADLSNLAEAGGGRIPLWADALRMVAERPLFGFGPDAYRLGWFGVRSVEWVRLNGTDLVVHDAHNMILQFAATLGVPATLVAIALFVRGLWVSAAPALRARDDADRQLYAGWWAASIGLAVTLPFTVNTITMLVVTFVALGMLMTTRAKDTEFSRTVRVAIAAAAVLLAVVGAAVGTLSFAADAMIHSASSGVDPVSRFEQISRIAPWYGEPRLLAATARAEAVRTELESGATVSVERVGAAEEGLRQLAAYDPADPRYASAYASFLTMLGEFDSSGDASRRAVTAGERVLALSPSDPRAAGKLALAQLRLGDAAGAAATLEGLWDVDRKLIDPGLVYVQALAATGERDRALDALAVLEVRFPGDNAIAQVRSQIESPTAP